VAVVLARMRECLSNFCNNSDVAHKLAACTTCACGGGLQPCNFRYGYIFISSALKLATSPRDKCAFDTLQICVPSPNAQACTNAESVLRICFASSTFGHIYCTWVCTPHPIAGRPTNPEYVFRLGTQIFRLHSACYSSSRVGLSRALPSSAGQNCTSLTCMSQIGYLCTVCMNVPCARRLATLCPAVLVHSRLPLLWALRLTTRNHVLHCLKSQQQLTSEPPKRGLGSIRLLYSEQCLLRQKTFAGPVDGPTQHTC
jgi:hypothetical protein